DDRGGEPGRRDHQDLDRDPDRGGPGGDADRGLGRPAGDGDVPDSSGDEEPRPGGATESRGDPPDRTGGAEPQPPWHPARQSHEVLRGTTPWIRPNSSRG